MIFLLLFLTFFKIGLFAFGGGYAMISLIQGEVVSKYGWLTTSQFTDVIAISQMTPGPIGINSATYVGYAAITNAGYSATMGMLGSALATFSVILPSFLLMLFVVKILTRFKESPVIESMFALLRPTILGLIAAACLLLMNKENFGSYNDSPWQFFTSLFLFAATIYGVQILKISPIRMLIFCAIAGLFLYY